MMGHWEWAARWADGVFGEGLLGGRDQLVEAANFERGILQSV